jgi:N-acetylneuraminate synthase
LDYKYRREFGKEEYEEIDQYCREKEIAWFASVWDEDSVDFMKRFTSFSKIPSALITNNALLIHARENCKYLMVSTGMSNELEISSCIDIAQPDLIFHSNSTYPSPVDELNLNYIGWLQKKYPNKEIGYSGHEFGLVPTFAAVTLGATWIERHVTLDRTMWGSDQMASVEPGGLLKMVKGIRDIEKSLGEGGPRKVLGSELKKRESLRGN